MVKPSDYSLSIFPRRTFLPAMMLKCQPLPTLECTRRILYPNADNERIKRQRGTGSGGFGSHLLSSQTIRSHLVADIHAVLAELDEQQSLLLFQLLLGWLLLRARTRKSPN